MKSAVVLRSHGGRYELDAGGVVLEATLRGKLKREERIGDKVVAGDRVEVEQSGEPGKEVWTIERVHERQTALVRKAPGRAPRPKVIVANIDQVAIVFATARPEPHLRMLDRFLVLCESSGLEPLIVVNKVDLVGIDAARERFDAYRAIGYTVHYTSVKLSLGVEALRDEICGRISAFTGPSGVGKSSLLNAIQPGLALRVASVGSVVQKGRHTTVTAELIPLECGGYVADTPGLRELGLWGIDREDLGLYFPEFSPLLGTCRYGNSCTHTHEPGCSVIAAAEAGEIPEFRYESYRRMMLGDDEELDAW